MRSFAIPIRKPLRTQFANYLTCRSISKSWRTDSSGAAKNADNITIYIIAANLPKEAKSFSWRPRQERVKNHKYKSNWWTSCGLIPYRTKWSIRVGCSHMLGQKVLIHVSATIYKPFSKLNVILTEYVCLQYWQNYDLRYVNMTQIPRCEYFTSNSACSLCGYFWNQCISSCTVLRSIQQAVHRVTLYFSHPSFLFAHSLSNDQWYKPAAIEKWSWPTIHSLKCN